MGDVLKRPTVRIAAALLLALTALELSYLVSPPPVSAPLGPPRAPSDEPSATREPPQVREAPALTGASTSPEWSDNEDAVVRGLRAWRDGAEVVAEIGVEMKLLADQEEQRRNVHFVIAPDSTMNLIFADGTARAVPMVRVHGAPMVADVFRTRREGDRVHAVWPATWPPGAQLSAAGVNVIRLWGAVPVELQTAPLLRVQVSVRALTRGAVREFEKLGASDIPMARLLRGVSSFVVEPRLEARPPVASPGR